MSDNQPKQSAKHIDNAYYHGRKITDDATAELYKPKLIDPSSPQPIEDAAVVSPGASKWNKAQTFESCDFSEEQIEETLKQQFELFQFSHTVADVGALSIDKVTKVDGFAARTFTRGKMMLNFDLTVTFSLNLDGEPLSGASMIFTEVDFTSIEDFDIKYKGVAGPVGKALRGSEKKLRALFANFVTAMLAIPSDQ